MADWKVFSLIHQTVYRWSGGRLGGRLAGIDMVNIHTVGRKSGKLRIVPIACYPYNDDVVVVASNNGSDKDPIWWLNLQAQPDVDIQLGKSRYRATAEALTGDERAAFWPRIVEINPRQADYQAQSVRELPVILLRRSG